MSLASRSLEDSLTKGLEKVTAEINEALSSEKFDKHVQKNLMMVVTLQGKLIPQLSTRLAILKRKTEKKRGENTTQP